MERQQWQVLLKLGNDCFHDKAWNEAEFFYSEAYDLLAFSYRNNPMCADTLMAWVCSCHNLSTLYEHQGNIRLALRFLMVPHEYLLEITNSKIDDEDVKLIAFKGLSFTLKPILAFNKKHPICDDCIERFTSLKLLLEQQKNVIH
ncbi:hypothetical protein [Colwellia sp. E150_009]|jgi:hypothetical protein|tara:strand:- start:3025 stop:3459 length:435 start_codon:yes stop_codon:yes gene_type:complete